jgi:tRNA pseudouridine38-40 synthase
VNGGAGEPATPRLRHLRLDLEYDGTDFLGWQRQAVGRTVQSEVERAVAEVLAGAPHAVVGAGRTDAGVHALGQVASFRTAHPMPCATLARALDARLPEDVGVRSVREAPAGFHARRDALWKWYRYAILRERGKRPLQRRRTWRRAGPADREALQRAADVLEGRHDFASFASSGSSRRSTVRTLHRLVWSEEESLLHLDVVGDGFLYRMVRTVVGTLLRDAEQGGPERVRAVLEARDRRAAGPVVPAPGLTLMAVAMRGEPPPAHVPEFLRPAVESGPRRPSGDEP